MMILAYIRKQGRLSLQSYGRPHMTEELQEMGLQVGQRRVGRLMRENGITVENSYRRLIGRIALRVAEPLALRLD